MFRVGLLGSSEDPTFGLPDPVLFFSPDPRDIYYAKYYGKGGGIWSAGEKNLELGKNEKGKEKRRKITLKKGKEALKMHCLGL